jgi:uncharacterized protein (TIGR03083 family)
MDRDAYLAAVAADGAALADAARLGLEQPVPSCPGWSVQDLLEHTGGVHQWVTETVRTGSLTRISRRDLPPPPGKEDLIAWYEVGVGVLVSVLRDADPDAPVWNWGPGRQVGSFWPRRMAHETAVHRWDGQAAHGVQQPVATDLAVDGIDEIIRIGLSADVADKPEATLGGTFHVHTTDAEGEWLVEVSDGKVHVRDEHGKGDAAVRGPASDLLLFLWGRQPAAPLEVFGDRAVVDRWFETIDI